MGTYKKGILGAFSGKVGTVVGSFWRGISYIRSLASNVRNPRTPAQVRQREIMKITLEKVRPFLQVIRLGFVGTGVASPWSSAVQRNIEVVRRVSEGSEEVLFDATKLVLTSGYESMVFGKSSGRGSVVDVTWTPANEYSDFAGGKVYVVAYCEATGRIMTSSVSMSAGTLGVDLSVVRDSDTDVVHLYGFAVNGNRATATMYI